jgi:amyloid beta precursor protein binding protein 1
LIEQNHVIFNFSFFIESDSIGLSRAQVATQNLLELNPDVRGDYIDESVDHIMAHSQDFFDTFSVVIATSLPEKILIPLSRHLWQKNIPLILCRSVGFLGYIRLQVKEHTIIEAHPDNENPDLRLDNPWPALQEHLDKINISNLDNKERSHVPALVILYYYLNEFKSIHG